MNNNTNNTNNNNNKNGMAVGGLPLVSPAGTPGGGAALSYSSRATVNFSLAPISTAHPTERDRRETQKILHLLQHTFHSYPPKEESIKREEVLGKLDRIVREWVKQMGMNLGYPEQMAEDAGAKLVTFGSYRLGVHGPGADIDTLCIAPKHVTRENFFGELQEMLLRQQETSELTAVRETHVPVIKMVFDGIQIDLLFAQLDMGTIPEDLDVLDYNNLRNVDDETQRSLNGPRVADEILRLVPDVGNFRTTLRCVKIWASRRAVYGNVVGYLGGIAWALLVAKICQLYPNALPNTLLSRFFWIYKTWNWPNPILLKPIEEGQLHFKVWNPRIHYKDTNDRMPIITPAYPSMNSTYNVSYSTLRVMKDEFARGYEITLKADEGQEIWETLFEETEFFVLYKHYLQIQVSADNEEDHRAWVGYMESRLRHLILSVEKNPLLRHVTLLHPYPGYFTAPDASIPTVYFYIGIDYQQNRYQKTSGPAELDLTPAVNNFFARHVDYYAQRKETQHKPVITPIKRSQIPTFVISEEKRKALSKKHRKQLKRKRAEEMALAQQQQQLQPQPQQQQEKDTASESSTGTEVQEPPAKSPRLEDAEIAAPSAIETSTENTSNQKQIVTDEESSHSVVNEETTAPPSSSPLPLPLPPSLPPEGQNDMKDTESDAATATTPRSETDTLSSATTPAASSGEDANKTISTDATVMSSTETQQLPPTTTTTTTSDGTTIEEEKQQQQQEQASTSAKTREKKRKRKQQQQQPTEDVEEELLLGIPSITEEEDDASDASPNKRTKKADTKSTTTTKKTITKKKGLKMRLSM